MLREDVEEGNKLYGQLRQRLTEEISVTEARVVRDLMQLIEMQLSGQRGNV